MTGKDYAEASKVNLGDVSKTSGYSRRWLDKFAEQHPERLKLLCDGQAMQDLGLTAAELHAYVKLKQSIEGK